MITTFLALLVALAGCQAFAAVKLADWLSPTTDAGRGETGAVRGAVSLA